MKKKIALLLVAALSVSMLAACGSKPAETQAPAAAEEETEAAGGEVEAEALTLVEGKLMIGMEIGYPPMEYFDEDGATPIGFDVELANAIADKMGLELEIVDTAWDGIFAGVDTDKYYAIMSCVSWTEGRNENYNLSRTYVANAPVLVVPNDSAIQDVADLTADSKVAVQMETTADYLMQEMINDGTVAMTIDNLAQFEKVINCFDEIKAGRVDAVCTDSVVAAYYLGDEAANYSNVWQAETAEPICIALKKGNDALQAAMEEALVALFEDGTLTELSMKYFGEDLCAAYFE